MIELVWYPAGFHDKNSHNWQVCKHMEYPACSKPLPISKNAINEYANKYEDKSMEYKEKFTLHIPHFSFKAGRLKQVDYRTFEEKLLESLNNIGLSSSYIVEASGHYKGRTYTEDLMTVFCTQEQTVIVENIINDSFANSNDTMQQESFAYEHNGTLYVYDLTQGKKG